MYSRVLGFSADPWIDDIVGSIFTLVLKSDTESVSLLMSKAALHDVSSPKFPAEIVDRAL